MELFNYDPLRGVKEFIEAEEDTGKVHIHTSMDVGPILKAAAEMRAQGITDQRAKKDFFFINYAFIPATVQLELLKKGIDINKKDHVERVYKEINSNYPYLKTTFKNHVAKN